MEMDAGDYILIGCVAALIMLVLFGVVAVISSPRPSRRRCTITTRPGEPEVVVLATPTHCRVVQCEGRTLTLRALGCRRCVELGRLCNPVEATAGETAAIERLRREVRTS